MTWNEIVVGSYIFLSILLGHLMAHPKEVPDRRRQKNARATYREIFVIR